MKSKRKNLPKTKGIDKTRLDILRAVAWDKEPRRLLSFQACTDQATRRALMDCAELMKVKFNRAIIYAVLKCFYNAFPNEGKFQRPRGGQWNRGPKLYEIAGKRKQTLYMTAGTAEKLYRLAHYWGLTISATIKRALQSMRALLRTRAAHYLARVKAKRAGKHYRARAYLKEALKLSGAMPGALRTMTTAELAQEWAAIGHRPKPSQALPNLSIYAPSA